MDQSNLSLAVEEDSGQTLTPSHADDEGKVFTFSAIGSDKNIGSFVKSQVSGSQSEPANILPTDIVTSAEDNDIQSFSKKKNAAIKGEGVKSDSKLEKAISIENKEMADDRGDVFERLIFCKARISKRDSLLPQTKAVASIKKSFWIYPITEKQFTQEEKEEADLLTTFGLNPSVPQSAEVSLDAPLAFITKHFSKYNVNSTSMFSFVLNKNEKQDHYNNAYNKSGLRYQYGCLAADFELVKVIDKHKQVGYRLEPCQSLILLESKYPFALFFKSVLGHIFNIVRLKRLELFAQHYNGNERDASNIEKVRYYDAAATLPVYFKTYQDPQH